MNNPSLNCLTKGGAATWKGFQSHKSLFYASPECGLPIGNLTGQVFANFYLNRFDHFIKKDLGVRFYGRYVDDFILVHEDKDFLKSTLTKISCFLQEQLELKLHPQKIYLQHYHKGVLFLGVFIKTSSVMIGRRSKGSFFNAIQKQNEIIKNHRPNDNERQHFMSSINSYFGILSHYDTYHLRKVFLKQHLNPKWWSWFRAQNDFKKIIKIK